MRAWTVLGCSAVLMVSLRAGGAEVTDQEFDLVEAGIA